MSHYGTFDSEWDFVVGKHTVFIKNKEHLSKTAAWALKRLAEQEIKRRTEDAAKLIEEKNYPQSVLDK